MLISRAGKWTAGVIDQPPTTVWVRGIPKADVTTVARLFNKVVWIATGSGIAPCLSHLLSSEVSAKLVWVTRNPERTYGADLVSEITAVQSDALFWDSSAHGRPDLTELAVQAYHDSGAEAVFCVSNKQTTLGLIGALRLRGIPAYGPIWDS